MLVLPIDVSAGELIHAVAPYPWWSAEAGVNTLRPEMETDDEGRFTSFAIVQSAPEAWPTLRSHRLVVGLYDHHVDISFVQRIRGKDHAAYLAFGGWAAVVTGGDPFFVIFIVPGVLLAIASIP